MAQVLIRFGAMKAKICYREAKIMISCLVAKVAMFSTVALGTIPWLVASVTTHFWAVLVMTIYLGRRVMTV